MVCDGKMDEADGANWGGFFQEKFKKQKNGWIYPIRFIHLSIASHILNSLKFPNS
jgi:hypothetical protein